MAKGAAKKSKPKKAKAAPGKKKTAKKPKKISHVKRNTKAKIKIRKRVQKPNKKIQKKIEGQKQLLKSEQMPQLIPAPRKLLFLPPPESERVAPSAITKQEPAQPPETIMKKKPPETIEPMPSTESAAEKPATARPAEKEEKPYTIPSGAITPALDMLPQWEDRLRLKRAISEDGLEFFMPKDGSKEYQEAMSLLGIKDAIPQSHFIVCMKDRSGAMIGAMDGYVIDGTVVIGHSFVNHDKKREAHILLYGAALGGGKPAHVISSMGVESFNKDTAGKFILYGRGFGMHALPFIVSGNLFLVRRIGNELDPLTDEKEIALTLGAFKTLGFQGLEGRIEEFRGKSLVALIPLPTSPDSREHLHELRDAVTLLGLTYDNLESVLEELKSSYVLGRADITPERL